MAVREEKNSGETSQIVQRHVMYFVKATGVYLLFVIGFDLHVYMMFCQSQNINNINTVAIDCC